MILLKDVSSFEINNFCNDFTNNSGYHINEPTGDNSSFIFTVEGETVGIAHVQAPIPSNDIEGTAQYAYNWRNALEETKEHKSHLIVSIMQGGQDQIKRFKIFTQVLCSLLRITNSIAVFKGSQSLLIKKEDYLSQAELMSNQYLPLNLWIYFGLLC